MRSIDLPQCDDRGKLLQLNGCKAGCWGKHTYHCEFFDTPVIPRENCVNCGVPEYQNLPEEPEMDHREKLNQILIQSNPNSDYQVDVGTQGIITVGGGKYWPGIYVSIRLLRELGYEYPIQVWHRGKSESVDKDSVKDLNVEFYDIDEMGERLNNSTIPTGNAKKGGWEAKLYALYHTRLNKIMFLDADAYCVANPAPLFDLIESNDFIFWQDLAHQNNVVKWQYINEDWRNKFPAPIQGGQLLINRQNAWKLIHAAHHMCQHSSFYFKHMYGDQDTWRVGLSAGIQNEIRTLNLGKADWDHLAFLCKYDSTCFVVHRCQGKLFAPQDIPRHKVKYSNPYYKLPLETRVFDLLAECLAVKNVDAKETFKRIYSNRLWGVGSGAGSSPKEAKSYIDFINLYIKNNNIKSVVDLGSGDGYIGSSIECESYIGFDCSEEMVGRSNNRVKDRPSHSFKFLDIYSEVDKIPDADLLLCKDVFHHWPNEWINRFLIKVKISGKWTHKLFCQDFRQKIENQDCHLGGYRALHYDKYPLKQFSMMRLVEVNHKHILLMV